MAPVAIALTLLGQLVGGYEPMKWGNDLTWWTCDFVVPDADGLLPDARCRRKGGGATIRRPLLNIPQDFRQQALRSVPGTPSSNSELIVPMLTLSEETSVLLHDGGSAPFRDAPFFEIARLFRAAGARTAYVEGLEVELIDDDDLPQGVPPWRLHVSDKYLGVPGVEGGVWVSLDRTDEATEKIRNWSREVPGTPQDEVPRLVLLPEEKARGRNVLVALRLAADAGREVTIDLGTRTLSAEQIAAIERTFDEHIAEGRGCFGDTRKGELKFVIGPRGHITRVQVKEGVFDERCLLAIAKQWEFAPPKGGGVIIGRRAFSFPPADGGHE
jgi:hypothetical protein